MIAKALQGGWAILLRDAARSARRWQTYAARTAFSAALLAFVVSAVSALASTEQIDRADAARYARWVFLAVMAFQAFLATCIAPFLCASAVIEERREGTVETLVLTRLSSEQIHVAALIARLLLTATIILAALPVIALLQSLGGFSAVEALSGTVNALVAAAVLGAMGAFFGVFTRSPIVAAAAALGWAGIAFLGLPPVYMLLAWRVDAAAHVSPLFGHLAEDLSALGPALLYGPVAAGVAVLGARAFELRVSGAGLQRYFDGTLWHWRARGVAALVWLVWMGVAVPAGVVGVWVEASGGSTGWWVPWVGVLGRLLVWFGVALTVWLGTSLYLQAAMDVVMVVDRALAVGRGGVSGKRVRVWRYPVLWRELATGALTLGGPLLGVWFLLMYLLFQSGIWLVPGGLVAAAVAQGAAGTALGVRRATGSVERERREGTLPLLLLSGVSGPGFVFGKAMGGLVPAWAMTLAAWPLWLMGRPYVGVLVRGRELEVEVFESLLACLWTLPVVSLAVVSAVGVALRVRRPQNALAVSAGVVGFLGVGAPALLLVTQAWPWLAHPLRLIVPPLSLGADWRHLVVSSALFTLASVAAFVVIAARARAWGLRDA